MLFDEQRAILLDEPEPHPVRIDLYYPLAAALAEGKIQPHEPYLLAQVGENVLVLPMLPLVYHHVAQGNLGGMDWMAAFCCLCNAGTVFDARHNGTVYTFAAQGYYDVMVLLADEPTQSYWNHLTGQCVYGALAGASLERLTSLTQVRAADALIAYPHALVASIDPMTAEARATAERWNVTYRLPEAPQYGDGLLATAAADDTRLPRHDMGLGVWTDHTRRYYPILRLYAEQNVILDQVDGRRVVIVLDEAVGLPTIFYYDTDSVQMRGDELILSRNARYRQGILYVDGQPTKPQRPPHSVIRWYGFASIFPNCEIYGS